VTAEGELRAAEEQSPFPSTTAAWYNAVLAWIILVDSASAMATTAHLQDVTGFRGEKIVELCLTEYSNFRKPLFRPGFLGDKWPAVDFYVELDGVRHRRPYFLIQCKATSTKLVPGAKSLKISATKKDVLRLLQIPGPTYILGVHEPSRRVFVKSVHTGIDVRGITRIQLANELTSENLQRLYNEVRNYWRSTGHKPVKSVFA